MKRNRYKSLTNFCCMFLTIQIVITINIYAQLAYTPYMPSPQTWDFMKYGNVPVGLYTGRLDLQIPIYHYQDADFDINISLGYNSAGFIPSKPSGPVGLNWFLNCGGVITRRINDIPDDVEGEPTNGNPSFFKYHGILKRQRDQNTFILNENIENLSAGQEHYSGSLLLDGKYETTPDIFSFNFGKHKGSFMIDSNGKIHIFDCENYGTYKIDISGINLQESEASIDYPESVIKIITGDGYIYEFGGDDKYVENIFFYNYNNGQYHATRNPRTIISWYLKSITAPNNRKVDFDYREVSKDVNSWWTPDNTIPDDGHYVVTAIPYTSQYFYNESYRNNTFYFEKYYTNNSSKLQVLKTVFLSKITINGICTIGFEYSKKTELEIHNNSSYARRTLKLDMIKIAGELEDKNVDQIIFSYDYYGQENKKRLFLIGINNKRSEKYSFTYNQTNSLPSTETRKIDFWGFWNDEDKSDANLLPSFTISDEGDITYTSTEREPSSINYAAGLLNTIVYPTGGRTEITYEPHDYSQRLERRSDNLFIPKLYTVTGNAGGARVKKLVDINNAGITQIRNFIYKTENGVSSGILMNWPKLVYILSGQYILGGIAYYQISLSSDGLSIDCYDDEYICYSSVTEQQPNNGYVKTFFSTFISNPDEIDGQSTTTSTKIINNNVILEKLENFWRGFYRTANSHKTERGKILKVVYFNDGNDTITVEKHLYSIIGNNYISSVGLSGDLLFSYRNYIHSSLPIKKTIDIYNGQHPIVTIETYNYNTHGLLSNITASHSNGTVLSKELKYPSDYSIEPYTGMVEKNILSPVIEEITSVKNGIETERTKVNYKVENNLYVPSSTQHSFSGENNMIPVNTFDLYDTKGNILQTTNIGGVKTAFIWAYNETMPVVKAENITYSSLKSAVESVANTDIDTFWSGFSDIAVNTTQQSNWKAFVSNLMNNTSLAGARLTLYTYRPLVGMTSETDASGRIIYYEYDGFGRLRNTRDDSGNIIKHYEYHYQDETP